MDTQALANTNNTRRFMPLKYPRPEPRFKKGVGTATFFNLLRKEERTWFFRLTASLIADMNWFWLDQKSLP
jgi:hypothetical protein